MIVTVYSDRRTPDLAVVAHDLALAFSRLLPGQDIALFVDGAVIRSTPDADFTLEPQSLPANLRGALSRFADASHAVVGLIGPVTEQAITAFDLSDRILVVTDSSVSSLRAAQRTFKFCSEVGYPARKVLAVHLHEDPVPAAMDCAAVARVLKRDVFCGLPRGARGRETARAAHAELAAHVLRSA
ncbi:MAG: hypothetical protein ACT4P7_22615 [Gemmatimonadaceae bacterium]